MEKLAKTQLLYPIILVAIYLFLKDVAIFIPYLNVLTKTLENKLTVIWLVSMILYHLSVNAIVAGVVVIMFLNVFGAHVGSAIYITLIFLLVKMFREK